MSYKLEAAVAAAVAREFFFLFPFLLWGKSVSAFVIGSVMVSLGKLCKLC